jgi:hypothetical protein
MWNGDAGYRSPYLSHAKRALYHLSYIPLMNVNPVRDYKTNCLNKIFPYKLSSPIQLHNTILPLVLPKKKKKI